MLNGRKISRDVYSRAMSGVSVAKKNGGQTSAIFANDTRWRPNSQILHRRDRSNSRVSETARPSGAFGGTPFGRAINRLILNVFLKTLHILRKKTPNLVAKIMATKFGFVPDCSMKATQTAHLRSPVQNEPSDRGMATALLLLTNSALCKRSSANGSARQSCASLHQNSALCKNH